MATDLPSWPRPNFTPNAGQPFLLFAVFGGFDLSLPIDRMRYRAAGVPAGCELLLYDRGRQPSSFDQLRRSVAWDLAEAESPDLARMAAAAPQFVFLRGHVKPSATLDYLRDAVGIVQYLCDRGGQTIFDPHTIQFWRPADWQARLFEPAKPVPHEHVLILETEDAEAGAWIHTRGLRKFGRPDLSVHGVGQNFRDKIIELFNYYVEYLASGGTIQTGDRVTLAGLPPGGTFQVDPRLDHEDFHNAHAECVWPPSALSK